MLRGFFPSISNSIKALTYLPRPWVLKYILISGFLGLIVYGVFFGLIYFLGDDLGDWLLHLIRPQAENGILIGTVEWATRGVLMVGVLLVFKYIMLIIVGPIMSNLSAALETKINGFTPEAPQGLKGIARGIQLALSNISRELIITLFLLVLSLIPGLALVTGALILIVQAYYAGFGNIDFFMERRYGIKDARSFVKGHKGMAIVNGGIFLFLLLIPIVGVFIAPALCTISATLTGMSYVND